ncbi:hypothetical protein ES708_27254 [subsurface metagenome]
MVILRRQVTASITPACQFEPAYRRQGSGEERPLDILLQKVTFKGPLEYPVPVQGKIGGRETPAGDRRNNIHLIQKPFFLSLPLYLRVAQRFENAVGKGGGACSAAGKGKDDEEAVGVVSPKLQVIEAVPPCGIIPGKSGIRRERGT